MQIKCVMFKMMNKHITMFEKTSNAERAKGE